MPYQQAGGLQVLIAGLIAVEGRADLKQCHILMPARLIAGGGAQQAGQKIRAQVGHFGTDRVVDAQGVCAAAEQRGISGVYEAVGDAFVVTKGGQCAARGAFACLKGGQDGFWDASVDAGQGLAVEFGKGGDAGDFFDQVSLAQHIGAPCGGGGLGAVQGKAEGLQGFALYGFGDIEADEAGHPGRIECVGAGGVRGLAIDGDIGRGAAAEIEDHLGCGFQSRQGEGGVDTAFKPVAGVRVDFEGAACGGGGDRVPVGGFEEHVCGVRCAAGGRAAHDAGEAFGAVVIGDQDLAGLHGVGFAVQRR